MKKKLIDRNIIIFIFLALVGTLLNGGCTTKGKDKSTEGMVKLRFMHGLPIELHPIFREFIADFEKEFPKIRVRIESEPGGNYYMKLQQMMLGNIAPDVIYFASKSLADFGERGTLLDLRPYIEKDNYDLNDFCELAFQEGRVSSGAIYGIPVTGGPEVLYYNKALFDEAGIEYPDESWTWNEYLKALKALTKDTDGDGRIDQKGTIVSVSYWAGALPWIWAVGGNLLNEDMTKCIVNSPQARQAVQFNVDLENKYKVTAKAAEVQERGAAELFMTGKLGTFIYLPYAVFAQFQRCKNLNWDIALVPKGPKGRYPRYTSETFSIWAGSKHKDEAWKLVKFLCSEKVARKLAQANFMPARKSAFNSPYFIKEDSPYHEEILVESLKFARVIPSIPGLGGESGQMADIWRREIELTMLEKKTVSEALKDIEKQINMLLKER